MGTVIPISDPSIPLATFVNPKDLMVIDQVDGTSITGYRTRRLKSAFVGLGFANICAYDADPTGVVDVTAAFTAAVAALPATGGTVFFPAGIYNFASSSSITIASGKSVRLMGAGPDATILSFASGAGLTVTYTDYTNSSHFKDLTIATRAAGTATAITLIQSGTSTAPGGAPNTIFDSVVFRGSDGYFVANYWTTCVYLSGVTCVSFLNCDFSGQLPINPAVYTLVGTGVAFDGPSVDNPPVQIVFTACEFNYVGKGITYGNWAQGLMVTNCNFTGGDYGINVPAAASATVTITIASPAVVTDTAHGFALNQNIKFSTTGALPTGLTAGTTYYVIPINANTYSVSATPNGSAINTTGTQSGTQTRSTIVTGNDQLSVVNSQFNCKTVGIFEGTPVPNTMIKSCLFITTGGMSGIIFGVCANYIIDGCCFTGTAQSGNGIVIQAIAGNLGGIIKGNIFIALGAGIWIQSAINAYAVIQGNWFSVNTFHILNSGFLCIIKDNLSYNPVGAAAITTSATPMTYTAGQSPETIYMSASTSINTITQGAVSILPAATGANVNHTVHLEPNEAIIIGYSGTLTMKKMVH